MAAAREFLRNSAPSSPDSSCRTRSLACNPAGVLSSYTPYYRLCQANSSTKTKAPFSCCSKWWTISGVRIVFRGDHFLLFWPLSPCNRKVMRIHVNFTQMTRTGYQGRAEWKEEPPALWKDNCGSFWMCFLIGKMAKFNLIFLVKSNKVNVRPVYLPLVVNEASHPLPGFIWNRPSESILALVRFFFLNFKVSWGVTNCGYHSLSSTRGNLICPKAEWKWANLFFILCLKPNHLMQPIKKLIKKFAPGEQNRYDIIQFLFLLEWRLDRSCTGHSRYVPALINFQDVPHLMGWSVQGDSKKHNKG